MKRQCKQCGRVKPLNEMYYYGYYHGGTRVSSKCKMCVEENRKKGRAKPINRIHAWIKAIHGYGLTTDVLRDNPALIDAVQHIENLKRQAYARKYLSQPEYII